MSNHPQIVSTPEYILPIDAVLVKDGRPTTTSLKVAEIFSKKHKNVLQSIQQLDCSEEFGRLNFQPSSYLNEQNKLQPMYDITKDGLTFLTMGFTGTHAAQFKEAYIARFNAMEAQLKAAATATPNILIGCTTCTHLTTAIGDLTTAVEKLTAQLETVHLPIQALHQNPPKQQSALELPFLNAWWDCLGARDVITSDLCRIVNEKQCQQLTQAATNLFALEGNLTGKKTRYSPAHMVPTHL